MKLLDLSKMKKVATDGKTTTFEHEKGHKMVILHAALPNIQQEQIKRLALYRGGKIKKYAEGTPDNPIEQTMGMVDNLKKGGASVDPAAAPVDSAASHDTHITINAAPAAAAPQIAQAAPAPSPVAQPAAPAPTVAAHPAPEAKAPAQAAPVASPSEDFALKQEAAGKEALAKQQEIAAQNQQHIAELKQHADEFDTHQRSNPINPRAYQESMDSDQKAKTAIGLFLGGLGGGGTSNVALDFLNKQIDRDVAAQQKNFENRSTVFGAYQHLYENEVVAANLAKASTGDILAQRMNIAAAQLGTPQAAQKNAAYQAQWGATRAGLLQTAANAMTAPKKDRILRPGANLLGAQVNPMAQKDYSEIRSQFDKAAQADKALDQMDELYKTMDDAANVSGGIAKNMEGTLGYLHRVAGQIPQVGEPISKLISDSQTTRAYDSAQSALFKAIKSALPDAGDEAIHDIVKKNSPERGDSVDLADEKKNRIKQFIIDNTHHTLLDPLGLTNPR